VVIRQYRDSDLGELLSVWESASRVGHPFLADVFIKAERENIQKKYLPNSDAWVALEGDVLLGFIIMHGNEVGALFVSPNVHGKGIGRTLMNKVLTKHRILEVEVFKRNVIGRKFYSKFGFNLVRGYHHDESGFDMLCLRLDTVSKLD